MNLFEKGIKKGSKLHPKLLEAAISLGLNVLECQEFLREHPTMGSACWAKDKYLNKHYLFVGSKFIEKYSVNSLKYVIKHEILHKALYRDLHLPNPILTNIVLDILINKVLFISHPKETKEFSKETLPARKDNALLLVRCDVNLDELLQLEKRVPKLVELWKYIYGYPEVSPMIPSPSDIYFKLSDPKLVKELKKAWEDYPLTDEDMEQFDQSSQDNVWRKVEAETVRQIKDGSLKRNGVGYSTRMSDFFEELYVEGEEVKIDHIREQIQNITTTDKLENIITTIESDCGIDNSYNVYPFNLSEKGILDISIGFTKLIPLYHNITPSNLQPKLGLYLDTSPSMDPYREYSQFLIQNLADLFPTSIKAFSGSVKKISMEEILLGRYDMGISTSYDAVVEDFLSDEEDLEVMVVVTDGMSGLEKYNLQKFKERGKKCYVIYFKRNSNEVIESDLNLISEKVFSILI